MIPSQYIHCHDFPCPDTRHEAHRAPVVELDPAAVKIVLVSECAAPSPEDDYYSGGDSLFQRTTIQAFNDAGAGVSSIEDIVGLGVYLTTAVKCGKTGYAIETSTIERCACLLERELELFPGAEVMLLMGDVAIKAINILARRAGEKRVVPALPTYKLREQEFTFRGKRVYPSYLQAGPSFFIEKSKRKMIAEDIASALQRVHA